MADPVKSNDDPALDDTVTDVELDESLDSIDNEALDMSLADVDAADPTLIGQIDPEAGQTNIRDRTSIAGAVSSEAGQFVLGVLAALVGISVLIFAATMRTTPYLITAGVIAPPTLIWCFLRWKRWTSGAPYLYRLLSSLGEQHEAEQYLERHQERQQTKVSQKIEKLQAEGPVVKGKRKKR